MAAITHDDCSAPPSAISQTTEAARLVCSTSGLINSLPSTGALDRPSSLPSRPTRATPTASFISSPLKPTTPSPPTPITNRGPMLLYRLASDDDVLPPTSVSSLSDRSSPLLPPTPRFTPISSGSSFLSSRYPLLPPPHHYASDSAFPTAPRGLVPYAYDPATDELNPPDAEDLLHDPAAKDHCPTHFPWRGILNVAVLGGLILGLLGLFVCYPVLTFYRNEERNNRINGNIQINGTGQAPVLFQMPSLIDSTTPTLAHTYTGSDGTPYTLVFSDEFSTAGRTFYPGDDPFWEAVDLWYGATGDLEWYDPAQVTTREGALVITMDSVGTRRAGVTPGSTAPFTLVENHGLAYRSGMLQTWNKFCFTGGYIEVAVVLPGANEDAEGYWPGAWTMGNLARPGYPATTDGMWPYAYDSCDVGTFPNQTDKDRRGPAAALHTAQSRAKYNCELSWLSGQRLSACSCPNSDHPGPFSNNAYKGRGAPEIDIIEAAHDKDSKQGQTASQSAQFAPFTHDYLYAHATRDEWVVYTPNVTRPNTYLGSAVQQAVSGLVKLRPDMFQGSGKRFTTLGFEYWANPQNVQEGYITWQVDGKQSHRMGAAAVGPDLGPGGSGVGQRLIPEEPMSIVLNLGISHNWQNIDLSTLIFPAEFLIDYVRVYQREGSMNVGCSPKEYPTADYIKAHEDAYQNPNMTTWKWEKPKNSLYDGC